MLRGLIPRAMLAAGLLLGGVASARAQERAQEQPEARTTGLPPKVKWTFNFDAGFGAFGFMNSLFANPRDEPSGDLSDNWLEGYVKPGLSGKYVRHGGELYGTMSAVGARTYGSAPDLVGSDFSSFQVEDLSIGWRSGHAFALGENVLDFTVGRTQYTLGHGMLLWDGAADGGSRGGYWSNARKAFEFAAIARFTPAPHKAEVFYLDKDDLPESDNGTRLWGANYELTAGSNSTIGVTYIRWFADSLRGFRRDGLNVLNVRAYTAPLPKVPDLDFEFEFAREKNRDRLESTAWTLQAAYQLSNVIWEPRVSWRYARFEGDDPATRTSEAFDPLLPGFYDWGSWWQGEIAGEYFLANSNLISNQLRVNVTPAEPVETGLIFYRFNLDRLPLAGVTDDDLAFELDWYLDWQINRTFSVSVLGAFADPGRAVQQAFGRTKNFGYGMAYVTYSF